MIKKARLLICLLSVLLCSGCAAAGEPGAEAPLSDDTVKEAVSDGHDLHNTVSDSASEPVSEPTSDVESSLTVSSESIKIAEDDEISLVMVGDLLTHDPIHKNCRLDDGSYDYSGLFEHTKDDIKAADIAIVNSETVIGGRELGVTGYPSFNAPFELADEIEGAGFDVVCQANNHAFDRGVRGLVNCLDNWEGHHQNVTIAGLKHGDIGQEIPVIERKGIRIAILNYTYGINGVNGASEAGRYINILDEDKVIRDLDEADRIADFTIVCPHWGEEYSHEPSQSQKKWAQLFADHGADLVLGTHPHVIQPIDRIRNSDGRDMVIYYALGYYVCWTGSKGQGVADRVIGGMSVVNIGRNEAGEVVIKDHGIKPLVCHLSLEKKQVSVYKLEDYDDRLAESNEIIKQDPDFSKQYCIGLCERIWGENIR